eukprot:scaffold253691_cov19-Tisochrysis_lutea.AAC.1
MEAAHRKMVRVLSRSAMIAVPQWKAPQQAHMRLHVTLPEAGATRCLLDLEYICDSWSRSSCSCTCYRA